MNLNGIIFLKTFELSSITETLKFPLESIWFIFYCNLIIIFSHIIYRKSIYFNRIKTNLCDFFIGKNLFKVTSNNFLYYLGAIGMMAKLSFFDLDVAIVEQSGERDAPLFQDILRGFHVFMYAPVLTLFSPQLFKISPHDRKFWLFVLWLITIIFISFSINSRAILFDSFVLIVLLYVFIFLMGLIELDRKFKFTLVLTIIIAVPVIQYVEYVSTIYLIKRATRYENTQIENFKSTLSAIFSKSEEINIEDEIQTYKQLLLTRRTLKLGDEYYDLKFLNRFSVLSRHDSFYFLSKNIDKNQIQKIKDNAIPKMISIFPQPLINLFNKDFKKSDYFYSTPSFMLNVFDRRELLQRHAGSMFVGLKIYFGYWLPLALMTMSLVIFVIIDSFYSYKKNIMLFSPFIFLMFYQTNIGILKIFATNSFDRYIIYILRNIPQTLIFYFILTSFYLYFFVRKKN